MAELRTLVMSGSLRAESVNTLVAETIIARRPDGVRSVRFDLRPVPLFDQDAEEAGDPAAVTALKAAVVDSDAVLLVSPEYNVGVPAVMKNAVDWMSRPYGDGPIAGKAVGIVSASPSSRGGSGSRQRLSESLGVLTKRLFVETLGLASIHNKMNNGALNEDGLAELLPWLERFYEFASA